MSLPSYFAYLLAMASVTYLIRMLPLVAFRRRIRSRFFRSFLYYVPYAVLGAMTLPDVLYSTGHIATACAGLAVALLLSWREKSLLTVAVSASTTALIARLVLDFLTKA